MGSLEIAAMIISVFTTVSAIWGMLCKKMKYVILGQLIANVLLCVQYYLEGALSAAITIPFAVVLSVISFVLNLKGGRVPLWIVLSFVGIFAFIVFYGYTEGFDILVFSALCFFVLSITSRTSSKARVCTASNCLLWLIYDIFRAQSAILTHAVLLGFTLVGIIKNDRAFWRDVFLKIFRRGKV